jgi:hypothetical protein
MQRGKAVNSSVSGQTAVKVRITAFLSLPRPNTVIPGRSAGPDPESRHRIGSFWIPGSRLRRAPFPGRLLCPSKTEGDGAPSGATSWIRTLRCVRIWRDARASRRSIAAISVLGSAFPGTRQRASPSPSPSPSPASSSRSARSGARSGPEASRVRGYEPRPQAPHPIPSSKRLAKTPIGGSDN